MSRLNSGGGRRVSGGGKREINVNCMVLWEDLLYFPLGICAGLVARFIESTSLASYIENIMFGDKGNVSINNKVPVGAKKNNTAKEKAS